MNISEGRDMRAVEAIAAAAGETLLDVHSDADHNRSVMTLAGESGSLEAAVRAAASAAVASLDIGQHAGAHPRLGVIDVVPFVPLDGDSLDSAIAARDRFAAWAGDELRVPVFLYGPERSLPEVRAHAFAADLPPSAGPASPHPTAGAICAGARPVLVAYNVWLAEGIGVAEARRIAREIRDPALRALGLDVGGRAQVSMNLVDPLHVGPADAYDAVATRAPVAAAELVGLVPAAVLRAVPEDRWAQLDLSPDRTLPA
jgi:glutamate formiminotransferase